MDVLPRRIGEKSVKQTAAKGKIWTRIDSEKSLIVHKMFIDTLSQCRYNVSILTVAYTTTEWGKDGLWNESDLWDMNFAPYPI